MRESLSYLRLPQSSVKLGGVPLITGIGSSVEKSPSDGLEAVPLIPGIRPSLEVLAVGDSLTPQLHKEYMTSLSRHEHA